jgi:hypothetical protein
MKNILSSLNKSEKNRILEMHRKATRKNYLNEGVIIPNGPKNFGPTDMVNKTINLYEDPGKTVWDQQWKIISYEETNYGKRLTFKLDKSMTSTTPTPETGTMSFDCVKPDYFTYSMVNPKAPQDNITNEMRYNGVTEKLKQEYCPSVLDDESPKTIYNPQDGTTKPVDFASLGGNSSQQQSA